MHKTMAILAACAIVVGLSACSSSTTVEGCAPTVFAGTASKVISATGKIDTAPKVKLPTPLFTAKTQASTLIPGHGPAIASGQPVIIDVTIINGRNDVVLQKTSYASNSGSLITAGKSDFPAVSEALVCAQVGSRVAVIASPQDGHGSKADPANDVRKNDSFIYVMDIKRAFLAQADGAQQSPEPGVPAVVTTADGTPGITLPTGAAPKTLQTTVLKTGTGAKLAAGTYAVVKYTGIGWTTSPSTFDSTWKSGQAAVVQLGSSSLSPGLSTALAGQRVGSRVLVIVPANLAAPGDGSGSAPAGETVVYVVDILGIPS